MQLLLSRFGLSRQKYTRTCMLSEAIGSSASSNKSRRPVATLCPWPNRALALHPIAALLRSESPSTVALYVRSVALYSSLALPVGFPSTSSSRRT